MLSLRGGEPWAFGTYDESIGEVAWSPDGRWIAYIKSDTLPKNVRDWKKKKWDQVIEDEREVDRVEKERRSPPEGRRARERKAARVKRR